MGFLTKYGTIWGAVPMTAGRVLWVAPSASYAVDGRAYSASDNNDGLSPERALLTAAQAVTNATANAGDIIALLPGAHSWPASLVVNKAGLTFVGLPYMPAPTQQRGPRSKRPKASITTTAADQIINVTAADITFANLTFIPVTAQTGIDFTSAANRLEFVDCTWDMKTPAGSTSTVGLAGTTTAQAPTDLHVANCHVIEGNGGTSQGPWLNLAAGKNALVENCLIEIDGTVASSAAWASAIAVNDNGTFFIRDCDVFCNWAIGITKAVIGADMTQINTFVAGCRASKAVSKLVDDFNTGDAEICNNYYADVGATAGGTLVVAIT